MLSATHPDGPAFNPRGRTAQQHSSNDSTHEIGHTTPKSFSADKLDALLQMQRTNPFCKHISKCLSNGKALKHEADLLIHVKGLPYKHITDSHQKFLALIIPKARNYMLVVEAHDKLRHQGSTQNYCLIKQQYYQKRMNTNIRKDFAQCALYHREIAKVEAYPLQMTEIPVHPFEKIAIDLVI